MNTTFPMASHSRPLFKSHSVLQLLHFGLENREKHDLGKPNSHTLQQSVVTVWVVDSTEAVDASLAESSAERVAGPSAERVAGAGAATTPVLAESEAEKDSAVPPTPKE
jgi:hypothetical protein